MNCYSKQQSSVYFAGDCCLVDDLVDFHMFFVYGDADLLNTLLINTLSSPVRMFMPISSVSKESS